MTTQQQAWDLVRKAKKDLLAETDPEKRHRIAIWGQEMQELALGLDKYDSDSFKRCRKCGKEKPIREFEIVKGRAIYKTKSGEIREYFSVSRRHRCRSCTRPLYYKKDNTL